MALSLLLALAFFAGQYRSNQKGSAEQHPAVPNIVADAPAGNNAAAQTQPIAAERRPPGESFAKNNDVAVARPKTSTAVERAPFPTKANRNAAIKSPEELYKFAAPAVISIELDNDRNQKIGSGSAFFLAEDWVSRSYDKYELNRKIAAASRNSGKPQQFAYLATNFHVIEPAVKAYLFQEDQVIGMVYDVVTEDEESDLAVLCVSLSTNASPQTLPLADELPRVGSRVFAIGNPRSLEKSFSEGMISAVRGSTPQRPQLQTTAPISPGSSGGVLLSLDGQVVGITTSTLVDGQNLNFAVPSTKLRELLSQPFRSRDLWRGTSISEEEKYAYNSLKIWSLANKQGTASPTQGLLSAHQQFVERKDQSAVDAIEPLLPNIPAEFRYLAHFSLGAAYRRLAWAHAPRPKTKSADGSYTYGLTQERFYSAIRTSSDWHAAAENLKKSIDLQPDFAPAHFTLAGLHQAAAEWNEALSVAETALHLAPRCSEAYLLRGGCFAELNQHPAAASDFEKARELNPMDPTPDYELGGTYLHLAEFDRSASAYESAIAKGQPLQHMCYYSLGLALKKARKLEKAIAAFTKARSLGWIPADCDNQIQECRSKLN